MVSLSTRSCATWLCFELVPGVPSSLVGLFTSLTLCWEGYENRNDRIKETAKSSHNCCFAALWASPFRPHPHEVRRTKSCRWEHIFLGQKTLWVCAVGLHAANGAVCMRYRRGRGQAGDRSCHSGTQRCLQLQCTALGRSVSALLTCRVCSKGTFHRSLNPFVARERGNFEWFPKLPLPNALRLTKMFSRWAVNFLIVYVLIGI